MTMNPQSSHITKVITDLRGACGISLERAARALCISEISMSQIESGSLPASTLELSTLAKLYGVPISIFFESSPGPTVDRTVLDRYVVEAPQEAYDLGLISVGRFREITGTNPEVTHS